MFAARMLVYLALLFVLISGAPQAALASTCSNCQSATAGGVTAGVDPALAFQLRVAKAGNINTQYLNIAYTYLGELDTNKATIPNIGTPESGSGTYTSIPITTLEDDPSVVAATGDEGTYAYVDLSGANLPQIQSGGITTNGINAKLFNAIAKQSFSFDRADLLINGATQSVCLRGTPGDSSCPGSSVTPGETKFSFGIAGWEFTQNAVYFRCTMLMTPTGFTSTPYINGDASNTVGSFTGQINSLTWDDFTITFSQYFNVGDDTFAQVTISAEDAGSGAVNVHIDMARSDMVNVNQANAYFLYDPSVEVQNTNNASNLGVSTLSLCLGVAFAIMIAFAM